MATDAWACVGVCTAWMWSITVKQTGRAATAAAAAAAAAAVAAARFIKRRQGKLARNRGAASNWEALPHAPFPPSLLLGGGARPSLRPARSVPPRLLCQQQHHHHHLSGSIPATTGRAAGQQQITLRCSLSLGHATPSATASRQTYVDSDHESFPAPYSR